MLIFTLVLKVIGRFLEIIARLPADLVDYGRKVARDHRRRIAIDFVAQVQWEAGFSTSQVLSDVTAAADIELVDWWYDTRAVRVYKRFDTGLMLLHPGKHEAYTVTQVHGKVRENMGLEPV